MCRLAPDGVMVEEVSTGGLRPGDRIVVASDTGLMDRFGWNPAASDLRGRTRLSPTWVCRSKLTQSGDCAVRTLVGFVDTALGIAEDDRDVDEEERSEAVSDILSILRGTPVPTGWEGDGGGLNSSPGCARALSNLAMKFRAYLSTCLVTRP